MISNELSNNSTILNLEFNFDKGECDSPNSEVSRVKNALTDVFGEESFNLEITPNGVRLISDFIFNKINTMSKTKELLKPILDRMKNLDLDKSFTSEPIPRIGVDKDNGFLYCPMAYTDEKERMALFGSLPNEFDDEVWQDYIQNHLIPVQKRMSMNELFKKLCQVNDILGGGILDSDSFNEREKE